MPQPLIECVPNFSEGRNPKTIKAIADAIKRVKGVKLLNVDPGKSTNRTVYTFAGPPEAVCKAAFEAAKVSTRLIDMRKQHGEHPRFGALDVCPLIPISGISMKETAELARKLGKRMAEELGMTIYLYGASATNEKRKELSTLRSGEYEGLSDKLKKPEWKPDFGPAKFNAKSGASAVGARDFLVAYNVNLNTTSTRRANSVAFDIRERGRVKRKGDPLTGEIARDKKGEPVFEAGSLKSVKAIGWFIEEYGFAQVSINLTNLKETPVHVAFEECVEKAAARGMRVTGSELVGLIPLKSLLDAGKIFLRKQKRSAGVPDEDLIAMAIKSLGLDELGPFNPQERIIEYAMRNKGLSLQKGKSGKPVAKKGLLELSAKGFVEKVASESPAPGGGSVAALAGALGAALGTMVANLSSHKRGWDDRWEEFSNWAEKGKAIYVELMDLVEEDSRAFDALMEAFAMPKGSSEEQAERNRAVQDRTKNAMEVPLKTMETALRSMEVLKAMAETGNPNSVSDVGVGALMAAAAVRGAHLNVAINASSLTDKKFVYQVFSKSQRIETEAIARESEILKIVEKKITS